MQQRYFHGNENDYHEFAIGGADDPEPAGLQIVLAHDVWIGGAVATAVTVIGWVALIKGLVLLAVPPHIMAAGYKSMGLERYFSPWMVIVVILGLWIAPNAFTG